LSDSFLFLGKRPSHSSSAFTTISSEATRP
jgi:hypothetical protein